MPAKGWPAWRQLREARLAAGLTQRELARRAGTSQAAVARYETAAVLPDLDTLARLLLVCGQRLELTVTPLDEAEVRQLRESAAASPTSRSRRNRVVTGLAARAAAARRDGGMRTLVTE